MTDRRGEAAPQTVAHGPPLPSPIFPARRRLTSCRPCSRSCAGSPMSALFETHTCVSRPSQASLRASKSAGLSRRGGPPSLGFKLAICRGQRHERSATSVGGGGAAPHRAWSSNQRERWQECSSRGAAAEAGCRWAGGSSWARLRIAPRRGTAAAPTARCWPPKGAAQAGRAPMQGGRAQARCPAVVHEGPARAAEWASGRGSPAPAPASPASQLQSPCTTASRAHR